MSIVSSFGSIITKKRVSTVTLVVFVGHIFSPFFAYAMSGDPVWNENILSTEASAVTQLNSVPLPRTLVAGDTVTLNLTGSVVSSPSATFASGSTEDATLATLVSNINATSSGITASVQTTGTGKLIDLSTSIAGVIIGTLTIDRSLTQRNIRDAVTAVAQQALISLPQQLFPSDTIHLTLVGSGTPSGTGLVQPFVTDSAATRAALVAQISALDFVDATLTGATDIVITSSFSGTSFSLSNVSVVSSSLPVTPVVANTPAQAQKEAYNLARTTNPDETLTAHIAGQTLTGSDLTSLSNTINITLSGTIVSTLSGASTLALTAIVPGVSFATGNLNITGGAAAVVPLVPNRLAVAQVDQVVLPRSLVTGDTVYATVASSGGTYTFSSATLTGLSANISSHGTVGLFVSGSVSGNTLTLTSRTPGIAFTTSAAHIDSQISSANVQANVPAVAKIENITFPRSLVAGDSVSLTINGNTVTQAFSGSSSATLAALASSLSGATVGVMAVSSGLDITISSTVAGQDFTLSSVTIENSNQATVLVTPIVPVKQKNTYAFAGTELAGDIFSVVINGTTVTGSTLTGVVDAINAGNLGVDASLVGQSIEVLAHTGGIAFTAADMNLTSLDFTGSSTAGSAEVRANVSFSLGLLPIDGESMVVGNCAISFNTGGLDDTDCSDNAASMDVTGPLSVSLFSAVLRGITGITYDDGTATWVALASGGTGTGVIFTRSNTQVGTLQIPASMSGAFGTTFANTPSVGVAQVDTIALPRNLVNGDTLALSISGQLVSQNIGTSTGVDFDNFINTLNLLQNISASRAGDVITLTAKTPGTPFILNFGRLTHLSASILSVSNDVGRTEQQSLNFPSYIQNGNNLSFGIDGTALTGTFVSDVTTTFASILASSPIPGIVFSMSGSNDMLITSTVTGALFSVNPLSIASGFSPATLTGNTVAGYQKDTITLPFTPVSGDNITVSVSGATQSGTFTRAFAGDLSTTMGLLVSDISSLTGTVSASLDGTSHIITLDAVTAGNGFSATLSVGGATIAPTTLTDNTGSLAQIDQITLGRTIAVGDTLSLTVNTGSFARAFAVDQDTTMNSLASDINTALTGAVSASYAGGVLTLTSQVEGTPFTTSALTIATTVSSASVQPNIVPVAQQDFVDFERDPLAGDVFAIDFSGTLSGTFSGSTLTGLINSANLSLSGVASLTLSGTHAIEVTSSVAGTPFALSNAVRSNTPSANGNYTANVVSVFPIREVDLPAATPGDVLTVTVNNGSVFTATGSDAASLVASLNASSVVTATLSGSTVSILGNLDVSLTVSTANVVNSTAVTLNQAFVPAVARSVELIPTVTAPATTLNSGWTMSVTLNGANFAYLTQSGDTINTVVNALYNQMALTGSLTASGLLLPAASGGILVSTGISSTGATIGLPMISAISEIPGVGFTESFSIVDITNPILSTSVAQAPQTLRSGQSLSVTGTLRADEPGTIYFVSSALTITGATQIANAVALGQAFSGATDMAGNVTLPSSLVLPALSVDGVYNVIAVDRSDNLSMGMVGWLTVDNTAPVLSITTPNNRIVNQDTFSLSGTAEANVSVDITLGTGSLHTVSLGDGSWSGTLALPQNTGSVASVTATDSVGNTTVRTLNMTEDSLIPALSFAASSLNTNLANVTLSGSTKPGVTVTVSGGSGSVNTVADGSGSFSLSVPLTINANNMLVVDVVDQAGNTNSGTVSVIQDSIAPSVVISTLPQIVHAPSIVLAWVTENNSTLIVTNGSGTIVGTGTATSTGVWSIASTLVPNIANTLTVTATDTAGNTGSSSVIITEDSTPNSLVISTSAQTLNAVSLTVTGTTKPNSAIDITGGAATATGVANGAGLYSLSVSLTQNATNTLLVTSTDVVNNVSTGSVIIVTDSINPVTVIGTPVHTTYNPIVTLTGTTEALATVVITGGSGTTQTVADGSGAWSLPVTLNLSAVNTLVATATDLAGNTGSASVAITHDSVPVFLTMTVPNQTVHAATFSFTGTTKSGATVMIQNNTGSVTTLIAPASGTFTGTVNLAPNATNTVHVAVQDATLAFATGSFVITEDSTAPTLTFANPSGATTALGNVVLQGTTEAGAQISINNNGTITSGSASGSGTFSITVPLHANVLNTLNVTATDSVGNVGTGTWTVVQDSLGPVVSNLAVSPSIVGSNMIAVYSFTTNENSTGVFSIGTGANVLATLVATGTTAGTTHNSLVSGLLANTNYYYVLTTTDSIGNSTTSNVGVINSTDTVPPTIQDVTLSHLGSTGASLDFTFTEPNFNTQYATGSITITTSTGMTVGTYPTVFSSGVVSAGSTVLSGLASGTAYTYTVLLTDTFGNASVTTGTFSTPTVVPLTGGIVTQTGAVSIGAGGAGTTTLSGTTITIVSNPNDIDSLTGSLVLSGITSVVSSSGAWNGVLLSPVLVASNLAESATAMELSSLITGLNNTTTTYALGQIYQTVKAGAEGVSITAVGGTFQVSFAVSTASVGQTLRLYRSTDGNVWQNNSPDATCTTDAQKMCTFRTDHLSYFAPASVVTTPVVFTSSSGGGGGGISKDSCPSGDTSPSYYDGVCGTKATNTTVTGTGTSMENTKQNITFTNEIDSVATVGGVVSQEKLDQYIKEIQYRVYTRTLSNPERILAFSAMNRYIDRQTELTTDTAKKTVLAALKNGLNDIIAQLREDIANGVTAIPNRKKNNASLDVLSSITGAARVYRYVNTETVLAVRAEPNFLSDTTGYLLMNERVELLAGGPNWSRVKTSTIEGFVRTRLLRKTLELRNRDASLVYHSVSGGERGVSEGRETE